MKLGVWAPRARAGARAGARPRIRARAGARAGTGARAGARARAGAAVTVLSRNMGTFLPSAASVDSTRSSIVQPPLS